MAGDGFELRFAANENCTFEVQEYLCELARLRVAGGFEATDLLELLGELGRRGPKGQAERMIEGSIALHALRHERHVIALASCADIGKQIVVLTAFAEKDWENGWARAERIARLCFGLDD